jgi:hypothetical protein
MWYLKDEINLYYLNEEDHLYYAYLEKLKDLQKELNCKVELIDIIKSLEKKNVYLKKMIFPLLEQIKEIASQCASSQNDDFPYSPLNGLF